MIISQATVCLAEPNFCWSLVTLASLNIEYYSIMSQNQMH